MTVIRLNFIILNVSESGSHLRCCTMTHSKSSCNLNLFINYPLMFWDSIFELFLLVMQGTVTLTPPIIPDVMDQVFSMVRKFLWWCWNFSVWGVGATLPLLLRVVMLFPLVLWSGAAFILLLWLVLLLPLSLVGWCCCLPSSSETLNQTFTVFLNNSFCLDLNF